MYDLTNFTNSLSLSNMAVATNGILGGYYYGFFIVLVTFVVMFVYLMGRGYSKASCFAASCWTIMLLSLLLRPIGIINSWGMWICIFSVPASIFFLWLVAYSEWSNTHINGDQRNSISKDLMVRQLRNYFIFVPSVIKKRWYKKKNILTGG